jgi:hypothetical protein
VSAAGEKRWRHLGRRGWAAIGAVALLVGLLSSVLALREQLFGGSDTPRFAGSVATPKGARSFTHFLTTHDGNPVTLDITCLHDNGPMCFAADAHLASLGYSMQVFAGAIPCPGPKGCPGAYWFRIMREGDVQVDNGPCGAGNLVVKGPFSVRVEGRTGTTPPNVKVVILRGLPIQ